jgi:hypothetical protein
LSATIASHSSHLNVPVSTSEFWETPRTVVTRIGVRTFRYCVQRYLSPTKASQGRGCGDQSAGSRRMPVPGTKPIEVSRWLELPPLCASHTRPQRDVFPETASPFPAPHYRSPLRLHAWQSRDRPGRLRRPGRNQARVWGRRTLVVFGGANEARPTTMAHAFCWCGSIRISCCRLRSSGADPKAMQHKKTRLGIQETISPSKNH